MAMDIGGTQGGPKSDINVTPLVDVMLVLLIIMMLVAPMIQQGANIKLPEAGNTVDKPETQEQTVVAIDSSNRIYLNGSEVAKNELADRVKQALEERSEKVVLIRGDADASYSAIMEAMDSLHEAQIEDIGLITEPRKEPPVTGGN